MSTLLDALSPYSPGDQLKILGAVVSLILREGGFALGVEDVIREHYPERIPVRDRDYDGPTKTGGADETVAALLK